MVLTLGILGLMLCAICGVIAMVMGRNDMRAMDAGQMDPAGRGMTQAGWVLGIIGTVLLCLQLLFGLLYLCIIVFVIGAGVAGASGAAHGASRSSGGATTTSPGGR